MPKLAAAHSQEVPVINLNGLDGPERGRIGRNILEACETWGFFQCINHGVDMSKLKAVRDSCMDFFKLPVEEKTKWTTSLSSFEGYSNPKHKESTGMLAKTQEGCQYLFNMTDSDPLKNQEHEQYYPAYPPNYKPALRAYFKEAYRLKIRLLAVVSEALGLESNELLKGVEGGAGEVRLGFRANLYIPHASDDELAGIGLPSHTDVCSMLTILFSDEVSGLEIEHDNQWVKIDPVPGAYIVNVGDPLEILTNGRLRSVEHRAVSDDRKERFSCAVITFPQLQATLAPIPKFVDNAHPALYEPQELQEYIEKFTRVGYKGKFTIEQAKIGGVKVH